MVYYLYVGLGLALCAYLYCIGEDIFRGPDYKFGYNYKNPIIWYMCGVLAIPIINVIWIVLWTGLSIRYWYHFKFRGNND